MSALSGSDGFGRPRGKREVIDVLEKKVEDKSLDKLMSVRKQRINRFERERNEARQNWRETRQQLHDAKQRWRDALQGAKDYWQQARQNFFSMATTSGQFRTDKAVYERMKQEAAQLHLDAKQQVEHCKVARQHFFDAKKRLLDANRQQEKLGMLRDELRLMNLPKE